MGEAGQHMHRRLPHGISECACVGGSPGSVVVQTQIPPLRLLLVVAVWALLPAVGASLCAVGAVSVGWGRGMRGGRSGRGVKVPPGACMLRRAAGLNYRHEHPSLPWPARLRRQGSPATANHCKWDGGQDAQGPRGTEIPAQEAPGTVYTCIPVITAAAASFRATYSLE